MTGERYYRVTVDMPTWHAMLSKFFKMDEAEIASIRDTMIECGSDLLDDVTLNGGGRIYDLGTTKECSELSRGDGLIGKGDLFAFAVRDSETLRKFGLEAGDFRVAKVKNRYGNDVYDRGVYVSEGALSKILRRHGVELKTGCLGNSGEWKNCYANDVIATNEDFRIFAGSKGYFNSNNVFDVFEKMFLQEILK